MKMNSQKTPNDDETSFALNSTTSEWENGFQAVSVGVNSLSKLVQNTVRNDADNLSGNAETLTNQIHMINGNIETLANKLHSISGKVSNLVNQVNMINGNVESIQNKVSSMNGKIEALLNQVQAITRKIDVLRGGDFNNKVGVEDSKIDAATNKVLKRIDTAIQHLDAIERLSILQLLTIPVCFLFALMVSDISRSK